MAVLYSFSSFLIFFTFACQVFGFQTVEKACNSPLGFQDGRIPDRHFTATSYSRFFYIGEGKHVDMKPEYSRLKHQYAWCTREATPWLKVDLGRTMKLMGIATQGFAGVNDYYVKSFKISYSINGALWKFVQENGVDKVFIGNKHGMDIKNNTFSLIQARYIKIFPVNFRIRICLRMELYGCVKGISNFTTAMPSTTIVSPSTSAATTSKTRTTRPSIKTVMSTTGTPVVSSSMPKSTTSSTISIRISSTPHTSLGHSTTVASPSDLPTSSQLPEHFSTVTMTTVKTSKELPSSLTSFGALKNRHTKDNETRKRFIIIGLCIFAALLILVFLPFLVFLFFRRRKRMLNLESYHLQNQNEPEVFSFVELENHATMLE